MSSKYQPLYKGQPQAMIRRKESSRDTFDEVADEAKSAFRLASRIAGLINLETKCMYWGQTSIVPTPAVQTMAPSWSSMTPVILNSIQQGDDDFQRIGDSVKIQHLDLMFTINASGIPGRKFRVVVFWDETSSTPASNQVLEAAFFGSNLITSVPKDWDEKASTKILHDQVYETTSHYYFDGASPAVTAIQSSNHRISLRIDKHTMFEDQTTTIVTGALKFFIVTDTADTDSSINWQSRILYTDD